MKRNSLKQMATIFAIASFSLVLFSCKKDGGYNNNSQPPADAGVMASLCF